MKDNWEIYKIIDLVEVRVSNVDKIISNDERGVKLCNYMDAYRNRYLSNSTTYSFGSVNSSEYSKFLLKQGDVIITKDSETPEDIAVASVVIEDLIDVVCGYHLAILRPKNELIDGQFLMHKLRLPSVQKLFYKIASGSTRYGLTIGGIENIKLTLPLLPHQQKIAKILSTCDAVIEKTEAAIEKYKALKQGMMHDLFTRGIDVETGKLRPSPQDAPELYKNSVLGMIPKEWEVKRLEDVCFVNQGLQIAISNRFKVSGRGRYLYITIQYLNNPEDEGYTYFIENPFESVICRKSDVLMVRTGNTGMVITDIEGAFHNNFFKINYNKDINKEYLVYYLKRDVIQKMIINYAGTTTIPDLKHGDFYKIPFLKLSWKEQELISNKIKLIDQKLSLEQGVLLKYRQIKLGLMQDLLTGRVEVSE
jgi:type I restriction enzyme, S subunit